MRLLLFNLISLMQTRFCIAIACAAFHAAFALAWLFAFFQNSRLSYFFFESGRNRTCSSRRVSALNFPSSFLKQQTASSFLPHAGLSHITHVPMTCRVLSNLSYVVFSETTSRRKCLLNCSMQFTFAMRNESVYRHVCLAFRFHPAVVSYSVV